MNIYLTFGLPAYTIKVVGVTFIKEVGYGLLDMEIDLLTGKNFNLKAYKDRKTFH